MGGWFKSALGFSSHSGGNRDAFAQYQQYIASLLPYYQQDLTAVSNYTNPVQGRFGEMLDPLNAVQPQVDNIDVLLRNSALAQSQGVSSSAALAARNAAGGRGGLAYSGGAANIAARAAAGASVGQSQALADAMLQGLQAKTQFAQVKSSAIGNVLSNEANLSQQKFNAEMGLRQGLLGGLQNYATSTTTAGLQGQQKQADRNFGLFGPIIGNVLGY